MHPNLGLEVAALAAAAVCLLANSFLFVGLVRYIETFMCKLVTYVSSWFQLFCEGAKTGVQKFGVQASNQHEWLVPAFFVRMLRMEKFTNVQYGRLATTTSVCLFC